MEFSGFSDSHKFYTYSSYSGTILCQEIDCFTMKIKVSTILKVAGEKGYSLLQGHIFQ